MNGNLRLGVSLFLAVGMISMETLIVRLGHLYLDQMLVNAKDNSTVCQSDELRTLFRLFAFKLKVLGAIYIKCTRGNGEIR